MHHKKIYPIVHKVHHLSNNPTPWAAFSFHPIEAIIQIGFLPIVIIFIPLHISSIAIWVIYMMLFNVIGHLGYEFFPRQFTDSFFGKIFFTSSFHNMHHQMNSCNFGLYFIICDRLFGTINQSYFKSYNTFTMNNYITGEGPSD